MTPAFRRYLVADVGGTNSRLALANPAGGLSDVARFANDDFDGFGDVLDHFADLHDLAGLAGCCVAVAGPVGRDSARLTNRDWHFDPHDIARGLPGLSAGSVQLVNDLAALGHALPDMRRDQMDDILPPATTSPGNDQALVAGLGTGFNIGVVMGQGTVLQAELGHASLPAIVAEGLRDEIGAAAAAEFTSNEALFSGRGLARLFRVLSDGDGMNGNAVLAAFEQGRSEAAGRTVELMARLLGIFSRELVYQYLPYAGIHFAGGAARGILGSRARESFLGAFDAPGRLSERLDHVPVRLIIDDAAALAGAARLLAQVGTGTTGRQ